ncbi:carbonic anhydrase family protein [Nibricoccus sp. IMCC34717]|uniref:carbonic anhydrase family protein n=1 Tax=Nibricoccus sp. IMCC34717 TaxID=3034021 RepID=UPI00384E2271
MASFTSRPLPPAALLAAVSLAWLAPAPLGANDGPTVTEIAESGVMTEEAQDQTSPIQAFERLQAGNERFRTGKLRPKNLVLQREALAHGQHPFASIVSCMDSRTSVEFLFDANLGDLFNCRVAGNLINDDILGSLEYAHKVAGAKLLVVLGHSSCGAIKGAADNVVLGNLTPLCAKLKPAIAAIPDDGQPRNSKNHDLIDRAGRMNVIQVVRAIRDRSPVLREMQDRGQIDIIGAFYDLDTGRVEFYRPLQGAGPIRTTTTLLKEERAESPAAKAPHPGDHATHEAHDEKPEASPPEPEPAHAEADAHAEHEPAGATH